MAIGPNDQILLGCNAASPDGHRNTVVINQKNGSYSWRRLQDLGGADEVWFNPGDGHYIILCNTPCRTAPVPVALTGPEVLGIVDADTPSWTKRFMSRTRPTVTPRSATNPRGHTRSQPIRTTNRSILPIPAVGGQHRTSTRRFAIGAGAGITSQTVAIMRRLYRHLGSAEMMTIRVLHGNAE